MVKVKRNKSNNKDINYEKSVYFLALLWRFGFFGVLLFLWFLFNNYVELELIMGLLMIVYGVYSLIISQKEMKHFLVGMLDIEHRSMKNVDFNYCKSRVKDWKIQILWLSIIFITSGVLLSIMVLLEVGK